MATKIEGFTVNYWINERISQCTSRSFSYDECEWKHCRELNSIVVWEKASEQVALYIPYDSLISIVGYHGEEDK